MKLNDIARLFFGEILRQAEENGLDKFMERFPETFLRPLSCSTTIVRDIRHIMIKIGDMSYTLTEELKEEYENIVFNEAWELIQKILSNKEKKCSN